MSDLPPDLDPTVSRDFVILDELGRGSSATVRLARHKMLDIDVALKLWHAPLTPEQRARFAIEVKLQYALSKHPNVVALLWAGNSESAPPWMAGELFERSLATLLAAGTPHPEQAIQFACDLLAGLAAVHDAHHVHRDVKPANALIKEGRLALGDLGIAIPANKFTEHNASGTARFMARELVRGHQPSYQSDVYAAGVTIEAMFMPNVPGWLMPLLDRACSDDPTDRPRDARDFAHRFEAALSEAGRTPRPARPASSGTVIPTVAGRAFNGDIGAPITPVAGATPISGGPPASQAEPPPSQPGKCRGRRVGVLSTLLLAAVAAVAGVLALRSPSSQFAGHILSPSNGAAVPHCQIFRGTSHLRSGYTLVLGYMYHDDPATSDWYFEPVQYYLQPKELGSWAGTQYFGQGNNGKTFDLVLMAVKTDIVRSEVDYWHRQTEGNRDNWHSKALPQSAKVLDRMRLGWSTAPSTSACTNFDNAPSHASTPG